MRGRAYLKLGVSAVAGKPRPTAEELSQNTSV
jgi:hypothetical protein